MCSKLQYKVCESCKYYAPCSNEEYGSRSWRREVSEYCPHHGQSLYSFGWYEYKDGSDDTDIVETGRDDGIPSSCMRWGG